MKGNTQSALVLATTLFAGLLMMPSVIERVSAEEQGAATTSEQTDTTEEATVSTETSAQAASTSEMTETSSTAVTDASTTTSTSKETGTSEAEVKETGAASSDTTQQSSASTATSNTTNTTTAHVPTKKEQAVMQEHLASQADDKEVAESYQFSVSKNQTTQAFIASIQQPAQEVAWANDLYASVMVAQAILETGSGNSQLSQAPYYNLFGIKGQYKGKGVTFATQEDNGSGSLYTIQDEFRQYPGFKESLEDYAALLTGGLSGNATFYQYTWKSKTTSYKDATAFLTGRYATDTQYGAKLNALIEAYELTTLDGEPTKSHEATPVSKTTSSETTDSPTSASSSETERMMTSTSEATVGGAAANGTAVDAPANILTVPVQEIELWRTYEK